MGANPHANGGLLKRELKLPDFRSYAVDVPRPAASRPKRRASLGKFLRDVVRAERGRRETSASWARTRPPQTGSMPCSRSPSGSGWSAIEPYDVHLAQDGRVMEVLSEHLCQGWLEGYLLTGRHGLFSCYEAFIHIVDSMFNQHAKWLKVSRGLPWRRPIASLNYLLTSHVWRQDHNGFSHQDPGFVDLVANKKADIVRIYFPPDANTLLWITDHCLRTYDRINVIVAGKQPSPQWLTMQRGRDALRCRHRHLELGRHRDRRRRARCRDGLRRRRSDAGNARRRRSAAQGAARPEDPRRQRRRPDDAAAEGPASARPSATAISTACSRRDKPVIFAYHGYPYLIHRLTYNRTNHASMHVRGFEEEGTTTTPFDMVVLERARPLSSRDRGRSSACRGSASAPPTSSSNSATR